MRDVNEVVGAVFSELSPLLVEDVADEGQRILVQARTPCGPFPAPVVDVQSGRVHGDHERTWPAPAVRDSGQMLVSWTAVPKQDSAELRQHTTSVEVAYGPSVDVHRGQVLGACDMHRRQGTSGAADGLVGVEQRRGSQQRLIWALNRFSNFRAARPRTSARNPVDTPTSVNASNSCRARPTGRKCPQVNKTQ